MSLFSFYNISVILKLARSRKNLQDPYDKLVFSIVDFASIACCAASNHTDHRTNISWVTDFTWYPDKTSCLKISRASPNYTGYDQARIFDIDYSWKRCYSFETVKGEEYLIRGTFLYYGDTALRTSFFILVGVTNISKVNSLEDLKGLEYLDESSSSVLKVVKRINLGATEGDFIK